MFLLFFIYAGVGIIIGMLMYSGQADDGTKYCKLKQTVKVALLWPLAVIGILSWTK